jgi:hypothetical protein
MLTVKQVRLESTSGIKQHLSPVIDSTASDTQCVLCYQTLTNNPMVPSKITKEFIYLACWLQRQTCREFSKQM